MPSNYYEPKDLADFPNIAEFASEQGAATQMRKIVKKKEM